ncbi:MAG: BON domain-containing protein [Pirellulales bacterium]
MQAITETISQAADHDLQRRVVNFLAERHVPGLRHLEVEAQNGTVTLRGRVHSFYEKQLCQAVCRRVAGVVRYVDAVDVVYAGRRAPALAS